MVSKQMKKGKYKLSGMDSTEGVTLQFVQGARCTNVNTFVFSLIACRRFGEKSLGTRLCDR